MAKGGAYVVFVLPVVFTIVFSTAVLAGALDTMDRELNMWPGKSHDSDTVNGEIIITGLHEEYAVLDMIEFNVTVTETHYDCGTLEIRMYDSEGELVEERIYQSQCFAAESLSLPMEGPFSIEASTPGSYTLTVMISTGEDQLLTSAIYSVR